MDLSKTTTPRRALLLAAATAVITLLCLYGVFMETDYGKALFFTYDEVWDSAERQEAAGNTKEAERLIRHIVRMEENRKTMKFGLFVLFAGPDYLIAARLKLGKMYRDQGRLDDADEMFRGAVRSVLDLRGPDTWTYPLAELGYAEFLADTGRAGAAEHLALARSSAETVITRHYWPWEDYEGAGVPKVRALLPRIDALQAKIRAP